MLLLLIYFFVVITPLKRIFFTGLTAINRSAISLGTISLLKSADVRKLSVRNDQGCAGVAR